MSVSIVAPRRQCSCRIPLISGRFLRHLLAGVFLGAASDVAVRADSNFELAVAAKQIEIRWKQADLLDAQRELAILSGFLSDYETKAGQLTTARSQLASADSQLASIQQGNLVKLTIQLASKLTARSPTRFRWGRTPRARSSLMARPRLWAMWRSIS